MVRIAFCGRMTSGKTTCSDMVVKIIPNTIKLSFANRIKELSIELFGMDPNTKDRKLLQDVGRKMREVDPDVWTNALINKIRSFPGDQNIVVDDLRFMNEYEALKKENFIIIRLNVKASTQLKRLSDIYPNNWREHVERLEDISEIALNDCEVDYNIDSNENCLYSKIKGIVEII